MNNSINENLFKRFSPQKKVEMVNALTQKQLLAVTTDTIERIVKEAGTKVSGSRTKRMYIDQKFREGNNWNSFVDTVRFFNKNLYINLYVQGDDTDTDVLELFNVFMRQGQYRGRVFFADRYGSDVPCYFVYNNEQKAQVVKSILLQYLHIKYADKLNTLQ